MSSAKHAVAGLAQQLRRLVHLINGDALARSGIQAERYTRDASASA
jgi:hypothetical protein